MFLHTHPYKPFIFDEATKLIVGTLPPPRFTTRNLREGDVDFCYGSRDGQLWPILDRIFDLGLIYENTHEAVEQRKHFLFKRRIGICDIVEGAQREKVDASDLGMKNVQLRDLVRLLQAYPNIDTLLFTGGNSKNGPEYFFRKHLKNQGLRLEKISDTVPRIHRFSLPETGRVIKTVSLTAPSGSANRAVGSMAAYKKMKEENPDFTALDFRVLQYKEFF
jgi:G:T/U-mismatch repair DNA glycosylase